MHWGLEKTCFAEKTLSQSDSIESADQTRFFPYFHAGRETLLMQADVGFMISLPNHAPVSSIRRLPQVESLHGMPG